MRYWTSVFAETDIPNAIEGGYCYVWAKVRPRWYWFYRRLRLFLGIVWRRYGPGYTRMDWRTAWDVSSVAKGLTRKDFNGKDAHAPAP